ncbi:hypothetical protein HMPREF9336_03099 [Segniliparus rugosus ATCC BAA-974]|uniref:HTH tetR-type domain-containing protein n=2 Tax=Segniliparus rugosus TaxID=286804 RepID=E5XUC7_SEGRC|nr:hypothetical protein HMPREF9336_03099 [Segniliparus rugosus ATCC BAA-974]
MLERMPQDASVTKKRLLDAAFAEFAEHGLAGARVDRISQAAAANKRLIYVYFGKKDKLFETVVEHSLALMAEAVPFAPDDLPGYAGAMFDHLVAHPQHLRLFFWSRLEQPTAMASERQSYQVKINALAARNREGGTVPAMHPADIIALILGLSSAWLKASPALQELADEPPFSPERLAAHRAAVVAAAHALVSASGPPGGAEQSV